MDGIHLPKFTIRDEPDDADATCSPEARCCGAVLASLTYFTNFLAKLCSSVPYCDSNFTEEEEESQRQKESQRTKTHQWFELPNAEYDYKVK